MSWIDLLLTVPVTVVRADRKESPYGVDEPDWNNVHETPVLGWFQMGTGSEEADWTGGRDQQTTEAMAWLPAGTAITGRDRVVVYADTYEVIGPPRRRLVPWVPAEHHVRVDLRLVEGPGPGEVPDG